MSRCMRCGRPLSNPHSIARSLGPVCYGKSGGRWINMQAKPKKRLIAAFAGPNRAFKVYLDYMAQSLRMAKATIH